VFQDGQGDDREQGGADGQHLGEMKLAFCAQNKVDVAVFHLSTYS
jgi:hypothetical protein